jgi:hypothetical protein
MASRALAACARSPDDYPKVYARRKKVALSAVAKLGLGEKRTPN